MAELFILWGRYGKNKKKKGKKLILKQDGATALTCKINKHPLEKLFSNDCWFQNPQNSPDLDYPIEDLFGIIKPRIKWRNPNFFGEMIIIYLKNRIQFLKI